MESLHRKERTDKEKLWNWTAEELAHGIKTGLISSREAVMSSLNRIQEVNPRINALVEVSEKEALEAADEADRKVAEGGSLGPLHGVPVSIKVNIDQKGHATTNGVVDLQDNIALTDSPQVANLRKAGAIFVGRSNTPAFSFRWFTDNELHGKTLNPWNAKKTPGGSSGGAAASVASGMVPVALGNDIGGSVRYPAYACGVAGIRPTVGRIPSWNDSDQQDKPLSNQIMSVQGPLAHTISDLRLAFASMIGFDPRDPVSTPVTLKEEPLKRPIHVGLLRDVGVAKPTDAVNAALDEAAVKLRSAGYIVEEIELPLLAEAYRLWYLLCLGDFRQKMPLLKQSGDQGILKALKHYSAVAEEWWGPNPDLKDFMKGYARRGTLIAQLQQFLEDCPLILLPVSATQAFDQDADITSIESMRHVVSVQWPMTSIPTLGFPGITVPTSVVDGLPAGVQIIGRRFREDTLFEAADVIEAHTERVTPIDPN